MRKRLLVLLLPLLSTPLQAHAASPPCGGSVIDSSLPQSERVEQLTREALACVKAGKSVRAIAYLSEIIGFDPNRAQAYLNRGNTFARLGDFDAGLADYGRVIALEPNQFEGWYNRGSARVAVGQYDAAIADLTEAIRLKPNVGYAYCSRGLSHLRKAERAKALADFEKGLSLWVDMPLCYYGRGEIRLADGKHQDAIDDFSRGIKSKPTAESLTQRAAAYETIGEIQKALKDYRSALSLQPRLKTAEAGIARLTRNSQN
ncbi:tetratricopeptide repeat protein [Methyloceanibacter stevinii]|uniref:tetratricopeptide repeat protein n=1 Tax=Methyloceanibacter stevinii TaxID=1774970 RepID=UPI0009F5A95D|nr:tetratricopeptide repeat protein [Methyloceanibacter stevinii]